MSEEDFDSEEQELVLDPNIRKALREAEKERKAMAAERAALEAEKRAVQFDRLGIPETGAGQLFRETYQGDASADAIRAQADKYGLLTPTPPPAPPQQNFRQDELNALRNVQDSVGNLGAQPDPQGEVLSQLLKAKDSDEIMAIVQQHNLSLRLPNS